MKKPDPPPIDLTRQITCATPFGSPDLHGNHMFTVCEGIRAEDALRQACQILNSARASAYDVAQHLTKNDQALALGIAQQVDMAKALVDAVLAGVRTAN